MGLAEEHQAQLAEWLLSGMPYHAARALVQKEFGVKCALSAYSSFWRDVCQPLLLKRRSQAVRTADDIASEAAKHPGQFDEATIDALKQKAFELSISPGAHPKDVKALFTLVIKARDQELKERDIEIKIRRLELLEKQADKAKEITQSKLSPQEKEQRYKEIFGLA